MTGHERRRLILTALASGAVRVSELTEQLGVSDMTIRRDLEILESHGWLRKVHGGAVPAESSTNEPGFEAKSLLEQPAKRAIAEHAATLVEPHSVIGISAGTTTWMLARSLQFHPGPLTVVTNSSTVANVPMAAAGGGAATVILTGGVRTPSAALVGPIADRSIGSLHLDRLFLGVHGMDARAGFTTPNLAEAQTNHVLIQHARQVVVLADSTKWATVGLSDFGALSIADVLITDDQLTAEAQRHLGDLVGELIIVSSAGGLAESVLS
ncbi:MAG: DeoR/GlpR family DNA-binding transcription regulator [Nakamurella sp.]